MDFHRKQKNKISRTQAHILWGGVPPKKICSAEIGPNIESAEVHYTKQKMSSAQAMVWILSSAEIFFQQKSGTQFVQWSSAENQITLKSAKKLFAVDSGAQDLNFPPIFFSRSHAP